MSTVINNENLRKEEKNSSFNSNNNKYENKNLQPEILNEDNLINLSRKKRYLIFTLLITLNLTTNMDNGTVPALIDEIAIELNIGKEIIGLFGSLQYGGSLIGK
jgi:hypothetical protein